MSLENDTTTEKQAFLTSIQAELNYVSSVDSATPRDIEKQQGILDKLPANIVELAYAHLHAAQLSAEKYKGKNALIDNGTEIRGFIFEELMKAEVSSVPPGLSEEVLGLLNNPDVFQLDSKLGKFRNPDATYVNIDGNVLMIHAAGECKLGRLNRRAWDQINGGFVRGIDAAVKEVNNENDLDKLGLHELAEARRRGLKLQRADEFMQVLFVPRDRDANNIHTFINHDEIDGKTRNLIQEKIDKNELIVHTAAFSAREVAAIAKIVLDQIEARYS